MRLVDVLPALSATLLAGVSAHPHNEPRQASHPQGETTLHIPRPSLGNVPYGTVLEACTVPGTVALTFDDGPYYYTSQLLDLLAGYNVKATFFINGDNWGRGLIDDESTEWPALLRRMHSEGHQIGSHTWTHADLDANPADREREMVYNEMGIRNVLGFIPTYMRPPYGACLTSDCQAELGRLGYHICNWNVDTLDYENNDQNLIVNAKNNFAAGVSGNPAYSAYMVLSHDPMQWTVESLVSYEITTALSRGFRLVTVGECFNDPKGNWYRDAQGTGLPVSPDGSCGARANNQYTCVGYPGGNCCSQWGYCGGSSDFCGAICDPRFGECDGPPTSTDGRCGAYNGATCEGSGFGACCSVWGYCGGSSDFCGAGCNPAFGDCGAPHPPTSTDGRCGAYNGATCSGSGFGACCSVWGYCGGSSDFCGAGCNSEYGECGLQTPVSTDGRCGAYNGATCEGSGFGQCCSVWGYCGGSNDFCGAGCNPSFGSCGGGGGGGLPVSTDGLCGANGQTCAGSQFGECCSEWGFCGNTGEYCSTGCQSGFGNCS